MKKLIEEARFNGAILGKNFKLPIGVINDPKREVPINFYEDRFMAISNGEIAITEITAVQQAIWIELLYNSVQNQKLLEEIALLTGHSFKQLKADFTHCVNINNPDRVRSLLVYAHYGPDREYEYFGALSKVLEPKIDIGRCVENTRKGTFDYIVVTMAICFSFKDAKAFVKENKKAIFKMAVGAIERNPNFKRFGVPIGALKLDAAFLAKDCILHLNFGLKGA